MPVGAGGVSVGGFGSTDSGFTVPSLRMYRVVLHPGQVIVRALALVVNVFPHRQVTWTGSCGVGFDMDPMLAGTYISQI